MENNAVKYLFKNLIIFGKWKYFLIKKVKFSKILVLFDFILASSS